MEFLANVVYGRLMQLKAFARLGSQDAGSSTVAVLQRVFFTFLIAAQANWLQK